MLLVAATIRHFHLHKSPMRLSARSCHASTHCHHDSATETTLYIVYNRVDVKGTRGVIASDVQLNIFHRRPMTMYTICVYNATQFQLERAIPLIAAIIRQFRLHQSPVSCR